MLQQWAGPHLWLTAAKPKSRPTNTAMNESNTPFTTLSDFLLHHINHNQVKRDLAKRANDLLNTVCESQNVSYITSDTIRNWTNGKSKSITNAEQALAIAWVLNLSLVEFKAFLDLGGLPRYEILKESPVSKAEKKLVNMLVEKWAVNDGEIDLIDPTPTSKRISHRTLSLAIVSGLIIFSLGWGWVGQKANQPTSKQNLVNYDLIQDISWKHCQVHMDVEISDNLLTINRLLDEVDTGCWGPNLEIDSENFVIEWEFSIDGRAAILSIGSELDEYYWFGLIPHENILGVQRVTDKDARWEFLSEYTVDIQPDGELNKMNITRAGNTLKVEINGSKIDLEDIWPYVESEPFQVGLGISTAGKLDTTVVIEKLTFKTAEPMQEQARQAP